MTTPLRAGNHQGPQLAVLITVSSEAASTPWQPVFEAGCVRVVQHGTVVTSYFNAPLVLEQTLAAFGPQWDAVARFGEVTQLVVLDLAKVGRVDHLSTARVGEELRRLGPALRCTALVVLGEGLGAKILRATLAAGTAIGGSSARTRIFNAVAPALAWVVEFPGQHPSVGALEPGALLEALQLAR